MTSTFSGEGVGVVALPPAVPRSLHRTLLPCAPIPPGAHGTPAASSVSPGGSRQPLQRCRVFLSSGAGTSTTGPGFRGVALPGRAHQLVLWIVGG